MGLIEKFTNTIRGSRAIDAIQSAGDILSEIGNSVQGWAGTIFNQATNGSDFIGLDYNKVKDIRQSIRDYTKGIQDVANGLNDRADTTNAVKGQIEVETQKYLGAIKDVTDAYISSLLAYSDNMFENAEAYKAADTQLSSSVSDEASSLTNQAQTYTEKY